MVVRAFHLFALACVVLVVAEGDTNSGKQVEADEDVGKSLNSAPQPPQQSAVQAQIKPVQMNNDDAALAPTERPASPAQGDVEKTRIIVVGQAQVEEPGAPARSGNGNLQTAVSTETQPEQSAAAEVNASGAAAVQMQPARAASSAPASEDTVVQDQTQAANKTLGEISVVTQEGTPESLKVSKVTAGALPQGEANITSLDGLQASNTSTDSVAEDVSVDATSDDAESRSLTGTEVISAGQIQLVREHVAKPTPIEQIPEEMEPIGVLTKDPSERSDDQEWEKYPIGAGILFVVVFTVYWTQSSSAYSFVAREVASAHVPGFPTSATQELKHQELDGDFAAAYFGTAAKPKDSALFNPAATQMTSSAQFYDDAL